MQVATVGDLAQGVGRDVAGEDDSRNLVTEPLPQAGDNLKAVQTLRQIVVGDDEVRAYRPSYRQLQRLSPILGGRCAVTLAFEQKREHLTHGRVVLDDQDCAGLLYDVLSRAPVEARLPWRRVSTERHLDGEDRALARTGSDIDSVAQQVSQALYDGETEAEALAALARRIVELMKLLEDRLKLLFGDADPGVPDLDAQHVAAPPAAEQDFALIGVFHGVREQIADHLLEQTRIAAHAEAARNNAPAEAMRRRVKAELRPQLLDHGIDREIDHLSADDPGLELVDVEERVEHARHRAHGLVEPADQLQGGFVLDLLCQYFVQ